MFPPANILPSKAYVVLLLICQAIVVIKFSFSIGFSIELSKNKPVP
jgi:hypothetical protein